MRLSLLALLVLSCAAPSAQVYSVSASGPVAESFHLPAGLPAEIAPDVRVQDADGRVWAGVALTTFSAPMALGGGLATTFMLILVDGCFPFGCADPTVGPAGYAVGWMVGGAVGTMVIARTLSASSSKRGSPFWADDWKAALVGVGIGTLVGAGTMVALSGISDDAAFGGLMATSAFQAIGAGVAVALRP